MPVINCVQADANEPFAFLGAHCRFRAHDGGLPLVSRFLLTTLDSTLGSSAVNADPSCHYERMLSKAVFLVLD